MRVEEYLKDNIEKNEKLVHIKLELYERYKKDEEIIIIKADRSLNKTLSTGK